MEISIGSFFFELRERCRRRQGRIVKIKDTRRTWPTEIIKQGSKGLVDTKVAIR